MLRDIRDVLSGKPWSKVDRAYGTYVQVRENDVLVFDDKETDFQRVEPKARIDYNEVAGVRVNRDARANLSLLSYQVAEMHLRVPRNKRLYVTRTPQGGIFINAKKPAGWD